MFLPNHRAMWEKYRTPIAVATIVRSEDSGSESVFVVAQNGNTTLFYDDVEDVFAVGTLGSDNMLTLIGYVGQLHYAIAAISDGDV